jgi:hypothetical protein
MSYINKHTGFIRSYVCNPVYLAIGILHLDGHIHAREGIDITSQYTPLKLRKVLLSDAR